ncbi:glycerophosphoryl diester phosphodiesterase [Beutenbergia cavernae DSM 12333]|uniref:Glycerophosphoryl diester phosphodiesterase n=1 Tax=Beutenbergia cavernae (strain ATCC BAA-8 / DSM 12333 / CCUG 43141 / JCM 11478 / NBRC 16432 / NCIMB 13614 / HKI 0122) TaxID=471853 RepID=C5C366_BEUC1|nr:glycerophosphodiester phosphodiesterase family protein [Beutenbergia cavernae]ACQ79765.1 glycerophosphoryl diester phosphodiesterase [Beutenbergia cavernae DSM 12333]
MPVIAVGHRGAAALAPENTLASFARAEEIGVNQLELDLQTSSDGHVVVIHDASVDRTTNGTGAVADLTFEQLRVLDAGDGATIPTFAEVLDATSVSLQVEIKATTAIEPAVELLRQRPEDARRCEPTSFDAATVGRLAELLPDACVGLIRKVAGPDVLDEAASLGARRVLVGLESADEAFVRAARERGFRVDLWPIRTADDVRRVVELGADGFTLDDPRLVADAGFRMTPDGLVGVDVPARS